LEHQTQPTTQTPTAMRTASTNLLFFVEKFAINGHEYFMHSSKGESKNCVEYDVLTVRDAAGKVVAESRSRVSFQTAAKSAKRKTELYACELVSSPAQAVSDADMRAKEMQSLKGGAQIFVKIGGTKEEARFERLVPASKGFIARYGGESHFCDNAQYMGVDKAINKKRKYYLINASTGNSKIEVVSVLKEERQTIEEAHEVLAATITKYEAEGYKFPALYLSDMKSTHKRGIAYSINSEWNEATDMHLMLSTFCVYPGVKYE
jgi:hypothetical protein